MKNNEFLKLRLVLTSKVLFRTAVLCLSAFLFLIFLFDGILQDALASFLYHISPHFYYALVSHKSAVLLLAFAVLLVLTIYITILQMSKYMELIVNSINDIVNHKDSVITLPQELKPIENKLNEIQRISLKNEQRAREAEQKKNDLIVYMAHDLKTPLTSVIGYLTLLTEEQEISKDLQEKYIGIALNKSERLEELINEFFEITKFNLQNIELVKETINLPLLLEQLIEECYPMLEKKNLTCHLEKTEPILIDVDSNQLVRVFENLIKNAINYSYAHTQIEIKIEDMEKNVELHFQNKAPKIPSYKLDKLFEKFYRLDESRSTNTGGAGLGLAIAKQILELHRGTITVSSTDEKTEFIVTLPKNKTD